MNGTRFWLNVPESSLDGAPEIDKIVNWMAKLVITQDIDPLYVGLTRWWSKPSRRERFMVCYWLFYSVGASWAISKKIGSDFWEMCRIAAANVEDARGYVPELQNQSERVRWPRAHERRHFRGEKAVNAVKYLAEKFPQPENLIEYLINDTNSFETVMERAQRLPQFGPWMAFKVADMVERCRALDIQPTGINIPMLYKEPRAGLELAAKISNTQPDEVLELLVDVLGSLDAPGLSRKCSFQEIETCLCKWKSYQGGHYNIGDDIKAHRKELTMWGAYDLLQNYPVNLV